MHQFCMRYFCVLPSSICEKVTGAFQSFVLVWGCLQLVDRSTFLNRIALSDRHPIPVDDFMFTMMDR
jgi:hypothetical protein